MRDSRGKRETVKKKKPRTRWGSGTKYSIRKNLDYFLYLMAVPVSLTVTVLIPQMQFMS